MSRYIFCIPFLITAIVCNAQIEEQFLRSHIYFLASDSMKGRETGSVDEKYAAAYISSQFNSYGLSPAGVNGTWYQSFHFRYSPDPHNLDTMHAVYKIGTNVIGFLDNHALYTVVIGAHYDHLGLGYDHNALDINPEGKIHNGADDNASGSAGVMELARYYSSNNITEQYNFLFICFSGEELGLIGSKKFCDSPTIVLSTVNYMVNMDMIGRLRDSTNTIELGGVGTSPTFIPLINKLSGPFHIKLDSSGVGPSDHTSFYLKNIPVLFFFTGQHSDYHKPTDDADKINFSGEVKVLDYVVRLIDKLNNQQKRVFTKTKNSSQDLPAFKVTLGIMPDYVFEGKGLRVDAVSDNRPAAKAGLLSGDVIVQMGDIKVDNIQDYMKALSAFSKGASTEVSVIRKGNKIKIPVTF
ncbi:MAG: M28 family peptidase [Chitinophagales bacterium]|nr:M28 family peptidase [Chitinophagales bacterium]